MTIAAIREKLHNYINVADDKKVEAIFAMVETDIVEQLDLWEDESFLSEIKNRVDDFESNDLQGTTWEDIKLKSDKL